MPRTVFQNKRQHDLHLASTAEQFAETFAGYMQGTDSWHPSAYLPARAMCALVLVGSIPLGMGSPVSDIDLVAIVSNRKHLPASFLGDPEIVYAARTGSDSTNVVAVRSGLEIDITYITLSWLKSTHRSIASPGSMPPPSDVSFLAQIRIGWPLEVADGFRSMLKKLSDDPLIDVRSSVRSFVGALKTLEDASAARADSPVLALHLGRLAVERGLRALQAAEGLAGLGDKWLRLGSRQERLRSPVAYFISIAEPLLFPPHDLRSRAVEAYLDNVTSFIATIRAHIETKPAFTVAYRLCPQIVESVKAI